MKRKHRDEDACDMEDQDGCIWRELTCFTAPVAPAVVSYRWCAERVTTQGKMTFTADKYRLHKLVVNDPRLQLLHCAVVQLEPLLREFEIREGEQHQARFLEMQSATLGSMREVLARSGGDDSSVSTEDTADQTNKPAGHYVLTTERIPFNRKGATSYSVVLVCWLSMDFPRDDSSSRDGGAQSCHVFNSRLSHSKGRGFRLDPYMPRPRANLPDGVFVYVSPEFVMRKYNGPGAAILRPPFPLPAWSHYLESLLQQQKELKQQKQQQQQQQQQKQQHAFQAASALWNQRPASPFEPTGHVLLETAQSGTLHAPSPSAVERAQSATLSHPNSTNTMLESVGPQASPFQQLGRSNTLQQSPFQAAASSALFSMPASTQALQSTSELLLGSMQPHLYGSMPIAHAQTMPELPLPAGDGSKHSFTVVSGANFCIAPENAGQSSSSAAMMAHLKDNNQDPTGTPSGPWRNTSTDFMLDALRIQANAGQQENLPTDVVALANNWCGYLQPQHQHPQPMWNALNSTQGQQPSFGNPPVGYPGHISVETLRDLDLLQLLKAGWEDPLGHDATRDVLRPRPILGTVRSVPSTVEQREGGLTGLWSAVKRAFGVQPSSTGFDSIACAYDSDEEDERVYPENWPPRDYPVEQVEESDSSYTQPDISSRHVFNVRRSSSSNAATYGAPLLTPRPSISRMTDIPPLPTTQDFHPSAAPPNPYQPTPVQHGMHVVGSVHDMHAPTSAPMHYVQQSHHAQPRQLMSFHGSLNGRVAPTTSGDMFAATSEAPLISYQSAPPPQPSMAYGRQPTNGMCLAPHGATPHVGVASHAAPFVVQHIAQDGVLHGFPTSVGPIMCPGAPTHVVMSHAAQPNGVVFLQSNGGVAPSNVPVLVHANPSHTCTPHHTETVIAPQSHANTTSSIMVGRASEVLVNGQGVGLANVMVNGAANRLPNGEACYMVNGAVHQLVNGAVNNAWNGAIHSNVDNLLSVDSNTTVNDDSINAATNGVASPKLHVSTSHPSTPPATGSVPPPMVSPSSSIATPPTIATHPPSGKDKCANGAHQEDVMKLPGLLPYDEVYPSDVEEDEEDDVDEEHEEPFDSASDYATSSDVVSHGLGPILESGEESGELDELDAKLATSLKLGDDAAIAISSRVAGSR